MDSNTSSPTGSTHSSATTVTPAATPLGKSRFAHPAVQKKQVQERVVDSGVSEAEDRDVDPSSADDEADPEWAGKTPMPVKRTRARPSKEHVPQPPQPQQQRSDDAEATPDAEAAAACGDRPGLWDGCCACSKSAKCLTSKCACVAANGACSDACSCKANLCARRGDVFSAAMSSALQTQVPVAARLSVSPSPSPPPPPPPCETPPAHVLPAVLVGLPSSVSTTCTPPAATPGGGGGSVTPAYTAGSASTMASPWGTGLRPTPTPTPTPTPARRPGLAVALDEDSQYDDVDEGGDNNAEDETSPAVHVQRQLQLDEQEEEAVEEEEDAVEDSESEVQAVETKQEAPVAMATPTAAVEEVEQRATTEATPIATVTSVASPTQPAAASPADTITPVQVQQQQHSKSPSPSLSLGGAETQVEWTPSSVCAVDDTPPPPPSADHVGEPSTPLSLAPLGTTEEEEGALCAETFLAETQVEATPTATPASCVDGAVDDVDDAPRAEDLEQQAQPLTPPPTTKKLTQCVPPFVTQHDVAAQRHSLSSATSFLLVEADLRPG